jgi:hypothetical protein
MHSIINGGASHHSILINSLLEQFEVIRKILSIIIETYLLGNILELIILTAVAGFASLYLFASRAGQRILEGAISGAIAGVIIETGKHILNGNSSNVVLLQLNKQAKHQINLTPEALRIIILIKNNEKIYSIIRF